MKQYTYLFRNINRLDGAAYIYSVLLHLLAGIFILQWKMAPWEISSRVNMPPDHAIPVETAPVTIKFADVQKWRDHFRNESIKNATDVSNILKPSNPPKTSWKKTLESLNGLKNLGGLNLGSLPGLKMGNTESTSFVKGMAGELGGSNLNSTQIAYATIGESKGYKGSRYLGAMLKGPGRGEGPHVHAKLDGDLMLNSGTLSKDVILETLQNHFPHVKYCYEKALQVDPTLGGKISLKFTILLSGKVGEIQILKSSVPSKSVEACVEKVISHVMFPSPQGGNVEVIFPFMFRKAG